MQFFEPNIDSYAKPLQISRRGLVLCCVLAGIFGPNLAIASPDNSSEALRLRSNPAEPEQSPLPTPNGTTANTAAATNPSEHAVPIDQPGTDVPTLIAIAPPAGLGAKNRETRPLGPMPAGNLLPKAAVSSESQSSAASAFAAFWPLALVVAIILGAAYFVRKLAKGDPGLIAALGAGGKSPSGLLEVLGRYPVSRTSSFILLRLDRRILLLNQSFGKAGTGFSTLAELTDAEEVASILIKVNQGESKSMHSYLDLAMRQMEKEPPAMSAAAEEPVDTVDVSFPVVGGISGLRRPSGFSGGVA